MRERIKTCPDNLKGFSTEQLDQLLQAELQRVFPDEEVVLPILSELEQREQNLPTQITEDVVAAWRKFEAKTKPIKRRQSSRAWFVSVAAAVLLLVVMAVPRTVGAESLFDVLIRWTESVLFVSSPEQEATKPVVSYDFETDHEGLQQLYDKVSECGISVPVVPMWLPEGYELVELTADSTLEVTKVYAKLINATNVVTFSYMIKKDHTALNYEKDNTEVEVFETENTYHYIMENAGNFVVVWISDEVECSIVTNLEKNFIYDLIKSIYRRSIG